MENASQIAPLVAGGAFLLAFIFGAVGHKTNFCTMGAVSDWVNMGALDLSKSLYPGPNFTWLSYLVGGFLFGVGMTLGSGCGSKTLIRIGGGNLKSVVVFLFAGVAAYMTLRGILGAFRVGVLEKAAINLSTGQDLPSLAAGLGGSKQMWIVVLSLLFGISFIAYAYASREFRANFDYTLGGIVTGAVVTGGWVVTGHLGH